MNTIQITDINIPLTDTDRGYNDGSTDGSSGSCSGSCSGRLGYQVYTCISKILRSKDITLHISNVINI